MTAMFAVTVVTGENNFELCAESKEEEKAVFEYLVTTVTQTYVRLTSLLAFRLLNK